MQHINVVSRRSRRVVLTAAAAIGLSVAACSEDATAPEAHAGGLDMAPQPALIRAGTTITVRIEDTAGKLITDKTTLMFKTSRPNEWLYVDDNSANDKDPAVGAFKVVVKKAELYQVCGVYDTEHWGWDPFSGYGCAESSSTASTIDMGALKMFEWPTLTFHMQDVAGGTIAGGTVTVNKTTDAFTTTVKDNGAGDLSPVTAGHITVRLQRPDVYQWCEIKAPVGFLLTNPSCAIINIPNWETGYGITIQHERNPRHVGGR